MIPWILTSKTQGFDFNPGNPEVILKLKIPVVCLSGFRCGVAALREARLLRSLVSRGGAATRRTAYIKTG